MTAWFTAVEHQEHIDSGTPTKASRSWRTPRPTLLHHGGSARLSPASSRFAGSAVARDLPRPAPLAARSESVFAPHRLADAPLRHSPLRRERVHEQQPTSALRLVIPVAEHRAPLVAGVGHLDTGRDRGVAPVLAGRRLHAEPQVEVPARRMPMAHGIRREFARDQREALRGVAVPGNAPFLQSANDEAPGEPGTPPGRGEEHLERIARGIFTIHITERGEACLA